MRFAAIAGLLFLLGCTQRHHAWLHPPEIEKEARRQWRRLEPSTHALVPAPLRSQAVARLRNTSAEGLAADELDSWARGAGPRRMSDHLAWRRWPPRKLSEDARPFLVRGLAYGGVPLWVTVRQDRRTGAVWVQQVSCNMENLLVSWLMRKLVEVPVVVYLREEPSEVYVTALSGGDAVFRLQVWNDYQASLQRQRDRDRLKQEGRAAPNRSRP